MAQAREGAPIPARARRLGGQPGAAGAGEGPRQARARPGNRHRPVVLRARDRTAPRRGRGPARARAARERSAASPPAVGRAARPRIAPLRGRPEDASRARSSPSAAERAPSPRRRGRSNGPPRLPRPHVPLRPRRRRLARFRPQGDRARPGRDRRSRTTSRSTSSRRRRAIRSSRCGRISSTATSRRSGRSPREFRGRIPVRLGLEADYAEGHEEALAGWLARADWDLVLGSVHWVAGDWIDAPESAARAASRAEGAEPLYAEYYRLLAKAARTRLFDVLTHFDLPKKHGHRPARALEEAEDEAIAAAARPAAPSRSPRRGCASPSARPIRSRACCDGSSRRASR